MSLGFRGESSCSPVRYTTNRSTGNSGFKDLTATTGVKGIFRYKFNLEIKLADR